MVGPEDSGLRFLTYEPDPRHAELIVSQFQLARGKPVSTPGEKKADYMDQTELPKDKHTFFRSVCMRLSFMAQDFQFSSTSPTGQLEPWPSQQ